MPDLDTTLHTDMLRQFEESDESLVKRMIRAVKKEWRSRKIYGLEWGDPDVVEPLRFVRDNYLLPYVDSNRTILEIGPGGGRWTRYMLPAKLLYVVDYHPELLQELKKNFKEPNMEFIANNGTDFPNVPDQSIDFLFSFGAFVHMDQPVIASYLENLRRILAPDASVVIQYSDKTKIMAQKSQFFSENTPEEMRAMVLEKGYSIVEEDLTTMWHSSVIRFTL